LSECRSKFRWRLLWFSLCETNSPSHSAGFIIARFTSAVTNSHGGNTSMSIRWTWRNGCGERLTKTRKLKPKLRVVRSSNARHKPCRSKAPIAKPCQIARAINSTCAGLIAGPLIVYPAWAKNSLGPTRVVKLSAKRTLVGRWRQLCAARHPVSGLCPTAAWYAEPPSSILNRSPLRTTELAGRSCRRQRCCEVLLPYRPRFSSKSVQQFST